MADGYNYTLQQVEDLVTREFGWAGEISQSGDFVCYCSIHGDKNASLHVCLKNNKILIRCFSHGCEKQIYADLSSRGAWPQQLESREAAEKANKSYEKKYPERVQSTFKWNSIKVSHKDAVNQLNRIKDTITLRDAEGHPVQFHKKMVHVYTDGESAHSIVARYDAVGKKKRILQYSFGWYDSHDEPNRPVDPNNPRWQIKGWSSEVKHMLYALTYLIVNDSETVVVVEGEKAADYGNSFIRGHYPNFVFTTWKGGSQAVDRTDWSPLSGRNVIIIPDADDPGVNAGKTAFDAISKIAKDVKIIDILSFNLPKGWDIADYPQKEINAPKFVNLVDTAATATATATATDADTATATGTAKTTAGDIGIKKRVVFRYAPDGSHRDDCITWFNKRFGMLVEGGKMNVIIMENIKNNSESAVIPENVFHSACANVRIQHLENGALKPASKYWVTGDRRTFDRAVIMPHKEKTYVDEDEKSVINLWQGFAAENMDQSGSCQRFLDHLAFVCSGENNPEPLHTFILTFLARMIQEPHKRQGAILLFRGDQGSGKSIIGEYLRAMVGIKASMTVNKLDRITGQFNAQLSGKVLCRVEEAKIPKNEHYEALKDLSTNPYFTMEDKGKTQITRENYVHFIFTGNYEYMAPVAEKERRLVPVDVPDTQIHDQEYFNRLVVEMDGEGPGALFKYLKEYKLPKNFLPIPQSEALSNQKKQTKSFSPESMFLDWYAKCLKNKGLQSGPTGPSFIPWKYSEELDRVMFWDTFNAWQKENAPVVRQLTRRFFYRFFEEFQFGTGRLGRKIDNPIKGRFCSRYSGTPLLTFPHLPDAKDVFMDHVGNDDTYDVFSKEDNQQVFEKIGQKEDALQ